MGRDGEVAILGRDHSSDEMTFEKKKNAHFPGWEK